MHGGFQRVKGLTRAIDILLWITLPLQALAVLGLFQLRDKAGDYLAGTVGDNDFERATQLNLSGLAGLLIIPIAVLTIITMFRMAHNLQSLRRSNATWSPGWAIGGWFCPPCVIYAIPWLMFRELWRGSDPAVAPGDPNWKQGPVSPLVNVWWVLYGLVPLLSFGTAVNVIGNFSAPDNQDRAQQLVDTAPISIALAVVGLATAGVYLVMMRQLAARHMRATNEL